LCYVSNFKNRKCILRNFDIFSNPQPVSTGPVLAKLTPEICKGYLLDDIKAHQLVIDTQLERVEAEIMGEL